MHEFSVLGSQNCIYYVQICTFIHALYTSTIQTCTNGQRLCSLITIVPPPGCPLLTTNGLSGLIQLQELEELELTNCPGATAELFKYYSQHLPHCMVIE